MQKGLNEKQLEEVFNRLDIEFIKKEALLGNKNTYDPRISDLIYNIE